MVVGVCFAGSCMKFVSVDELLNINAVIYELKFVSAPTSACLLGTRPKLVLKAP